MDDPWSLHRGRILSSGTQAIARILLSQKELDRRSGLNTAGFISGYRGSPLGGVDTLLWSIAERLKAADILFQPGVNEDIAATAVRGTQQLDAVADPTHDGVFAAWYGKGPGVDRCGDAFKHGNFAGTHRHGGVLVFYGDDHGGKSSTVAHHSEQAMQASLIPSLYPANVGEMIEFGLMGFALSRYSGSWVGLKCVNEVVEQTASVDINLDDFRVVTASSGPLPPEGVHAHVGSFRPLRDEQIVIEHRLPRVQHFVRANRIDRTVFRGAAPRLGIVTAGKSNGDVQAALALLGLDSARAAALGLSIYKVGCIWPLEPQGLAAFAQGHEVLWVIEEKQAFLETQIASVLINRSDRPLLIGKADEAGMPLLPSSLQLEPVEIAIALVERLRRLGIVDSGVDAARARLSTQKEGAPIELGASPKRSPYFCSGCPHNRSTRIPEGSLSITGIGCHTMANFVNPAAALLPTQMGGEGGNWLGLAPFTRTPHVFQNMGDGTYYHSGLLAIRAAVAARVNITYKILYNDAVAMTGGQPIDGPISVAEIAHQLRHEGVAVIVVLSEDPTRYRRDAGLPSGVRVGHRDELDEVQRSLRATPGCSVLIYEQTCATEKRRRRKRGLYPDPSRRLFIAPSVCEGCGDCSAQSTCVSLMPLETELGTKRRIDQASCNKDYSCLNGFCPSFITVEGAAPRKPEELRVDATLIAGLPQPRQPALTQTSYNLMIAGIGGMGVITVAAILGTAAHLDGLAVSLFDMTGLAQKNGAVYSHVRFARSPAQLSAQRLGRGEADVLLAFDLVAALGEEATHTLQRERTRAIVNRDVAPTIEFQFDRSAAVGPKPLLSRLERHVGPDAIFAVEATSLASAILGESIAANLFLVGIAAQRGLLPFSVAAIERAVQLNGTAVQLNLTAFRLGRLFTVRHGAVQALVEAEKTFQPAPAAPALDAVVASRSAHLHDYQNASYARRYRELLERVRAAERAVMPESSGLAMAVARNYAKLLAYKDEYEVARLLSSPSLHAQLRQQFSPGARLSFNLAPPMFARQGMDGRPRKRAYRATLMLPILRLLARLKSLRGTPFDPFGRTAERRMERELIAHYERLVARVLSRLTPRNHSAAVALLALADEIRGFGPVKALAVRGYYPRVMKMETEFCNA